MDTNTVKYLANLARLDVPEEQLGSIAHDLESIIGYVDEIKKVEVATGEARDLGIINVFRDDVVNALTPRTDLVHDAPQYQDHFVKVPKVLGGE